ncbi:helix-turn-helix domain-containing protein [Anaeromicropila herbilytica]|nr:hypothetical protein [Anaeromicropila herbilytica]
MSQSQFSETLGVTRSTVSICEVEWNNHHQSKKTYEGLKMIAGKEGIAI